MNSRLSNGVAGKMLKGNIGIISVLLLLCIILSFTSPVFLTADNIMSVLRQVSNNVYLALGMTLAIIIGGIDLSVGSIVAMCGTLTVGFIVTNNLPMWIAVVLGILIGTLFGLATGLIVAYFRLPAFIVTMAMMNITKGVAYIYSGGRSTRIMDEAFTSIGTGKLFGIVPFPVVYMIILIIIFVVLLNKTKFGTYVYALGGNREAARLSGIPIKRIEITVYTLIGLLSAFAGIVLSARMYSGQPSVGEGYELDAIASCVLGGVSMSGGIGNISGTVFGAIVLGIISNGLNLMGVSSFWQLVVKGLIILVAVIIDTQKGRGNLFKKVSK
ncbi:ABC transporter permease [Anaerobium acetethylicum]|uniref:Ribose transport system permease protein n=1 Tax=Anaerobium acetethylicum TaxID=1619234 RepID=A0A1D3TXA0_9FIRM|nr:ribose ABC transporter permease [Anaerobium acetethylicum]SCP98945.1 ribose transport system permease protein [Anaerobium acetethylicum]